MLSTCLNVFQPKLPALKKSKRSILFTGYILHKDVFTKSNSIISFASSKDTKKTIEPTKNTKWYSILKAFSYIIPPLLPIKRSIDKAIDSARSDMKNLPVDKPERIQVKMTNELMNQTVYNPVNFLVSMIENPRIKDATVNFISHSLPALLNLSRDTNSYLKKNDLLELISNPSESINISEIIKRSIEVSIGASKIGQILSTDESFFKQFPEQYNNEIFKALNSLKSNGTATRTLAEAQEEFDSIFAKNNVKAKKLLGVGTIAETYLVEMDSSLIKIGSKALTNSKQEVIIKILKKNINYDRLEAEKTFFKTIVKELIEDKNLSKYYSSLIEILYNAWEEEINLMIEINYGRELGKSGISDKLHIPKSIRDKINPNAYKVVKTLDTNIPPRCKDRVIVMEKVKGIQLDTLVDLMKKHETITTKIKEDIAHGRMKNIDPVEEANRQFRVEYAQFMQDAPWLGCLGDLKSTVATAYLKAITYLFCHCPQFLYSKNKTVHADPHEGNIFVDWNPDKENFDIIFIDTGIAINFKADEFIENLNIAGLLMNANYQSLARVIVEDAIYYPEEYEKDELIELIAKDMTDGLLLPHINMRVTSIYQMNKIEEILYKYRVVQSPKTLLSVKAYSYALQTYNNLVKITGENWQPDFMAKEILIGILTAAIMKPRVAIKEFLPSLKFLMEEQESLSSFMQWFLIDKESCNK